MSKRESLSLKEKAKQLTATGLVALGALGLAGCSTTEAAPQTEETQSQDLETSTPDTNDPTENPTVDTPTETTVPGDEITEPAEEIPEETEAETEAPGSGVEKIRENWTINSEALIGLSDLYYAQKSGERMDEDYAAMRNEVCQEFISDNPTEAMLTMEPLTISSGNESIALYVAQKDELLRQYVSDVFRDATDTDAAYEKSGVELCLRNGVPFAEEGAMSNYMNYVYDGLPIPSVESLEIGDSIFGSVMGGTRYSQLYETDEYGNTVTVWRMYVWDDTYHDWNIIKEQNGDPKLDDWGTKP